MSGWELPLVAAGQAGILDALTNAPTPNQGGYASAETAAQFTAARDAASALIAAGHLGSEGIFTVRLAGQTQAEHGAAWDIPLESVTITIARHAPSAGQTYQAGPVTITLASDPADVASSSPIEAITIELARHEPRVGRRSYQ